MPALSCRVKSAIAVCELWYLPKKRDIRKLTERIEAMWFEVDFHVAKMEQAEEEGYKMEATRHLERILRYLERIQEEARAVPA